jgi:hypothetical protein
MNGDESVARERLVKIKQEVLSRSTLSTLITTRGLYKADRAQRPIEEIIRDMRARDIKLSLASDLPGVFKISFFGSSPAQAQQVTQLLVSQLIDKNLEARTGVMEVLDPPSFPPRPSSPNLSTWMVIGVVLGVLLGLVAFRSAVWSKRDASA